jgi:hypothetical protein
MLEQTQIPAQRVPLIDDGKSLTSREWFRFFNSLYNFSGLANGVVPPTSGGTGLTSYTKGDLLYASADNVLARLPVPGYPAYLGTDSVNMPQWIPVAYGSFLSTVNNTFAANTPTAVNFTTTATARRMTNGGSKVTVLNDGLYTITVSFQVTNAATTSDDEMNVWLRVNGVDVLNTNSRATVNKSHGGSAGSTVLTVNFFQQLAAGGYFELYGLSLLGYAQIVTYPASTSPAFPAAPSVILTVAQII